MKACSQCGELKDHSGFSKNKNSKDGLQSSCKSCQKNAYKLNKERKLEYQKAYYRSNKKQILEYNKKYRIENYESLSAKWKSYYDLNKEYISKYKRDHYQSNRENILDYQKKYRESNKDKISAFKKSYYIYNKKSIVNKYKIYRYNKIKTDPLYRSICNLRSRLNKFCRAASLDKKFHTMDSVGLSTHEFKLYIESLFVNGMSWDNYGKGDDKWSIDHIKPLRTAKTIDDVYTLNHYTNLQPLWNPQNFSKGGKWEDNLI